MGMTMLLGVLRMPPKLWDNGPIDQKQRHSRYIEAADLIERAQDDWQELLAALELCVKAIKIIHPHLNKNEPCIAYEAYTAARDAIAKIKAEGRCSCSEPIINKNTDQCALCCKFKSMKED